ncbi:hypothetical protein BJ322DRAFT_259627 [Thelephora terrestris]|uniref:Uncharacterized protein n=1 Tax=Thelephora terrestris TaxID=56493 RepID=A0A9P6L346_9AGAM|nr:hypothetical protein BJ322DRAFT_259627 [Thelephora terrestris]
MQLRCSHGCLLTIVYVNTAGGWKKSQLETTRLGHNQGEGGRGTKLRCLCICIEPYSAAYSPRFYISVSHLYEDCRIGGDQKPTCMTAFEGYVTEYTYHEESRRQSPVAWFRFAASRIPRLTVIKTTTYPPGPTKGNMNIHCRSNENLISYASYSTGIGLKQREREN